MSLRADLKTSLAAFDGRALTILSEAAARCQNQPTYLDALIALISDDQAHLADGVTWMVKDYLESGSTLTPPQITALVAQASTTTWAAQLHVCQSVRFLNVTEEQAAAFVAWLTPLLTHQKPFIRAWSVDALCAIANSHAAYLNVASKALTTAAKDPAASVKARARNIELKAG